MLTPVCCCPRRRGMKVAEREFLGYCTSKLGRQGTADEVAAAVALLCSEEAS